MVNSRRAARVGPDGRHAVSASRWAGAVSVRAHTMVVVVIGVLALLSLVGCSDPANEALQLEKAGDWDGALAVYEGMLVDDPEDLEALSGMATGLWLLGRYDEALPFQLRVVAADPEDTQTRVELGFNYLNHQGQPEKAVAVLEDAVASQRDAPTLTYLGQAQKQAGDLDGAEASFRSAIDLDDKYALAYRQLIVLLEEQGREAQASALLQ